MKLYIQDYINDESNCSAAFVNAISSMKNGDLLVLENKQYHFYPEGAFEKEYYISNNDSGVKPIALPIINKKEITIDGCGADLIFHGNMMPMVVDGSEGVVLKNFSIDYATPFYAQSKILSADENGVLLEFDGKEFNCCVRDGKFCFYNPSTGWEFCSERPLSLEFDENGHPSAYSPPYFAYVGAPMDHGFLSFLFKDVKLEERGKNLIFMSGSVGKRHTAGNHLIMTYAGRRFPGIFIKDAKNVALDEIKLYYTAAMGIVGQTSENISLNNIIAEPRKGSGRLLSVNADATHFINCRGKITVTNCKFVQMMDDASNVHGIYNPYRARHSDGSLKLGFGHPQHKGVQPYRVGDRVAVIDAQSNETKTVGCVLEAELVSSEEIRLKLDCDVPVPEGNWVTENLSTAPEVYFGNCESGYNRPRGFLISTAGKALVEKCKFYNMGQGIQISGEMKDWYESGRVTDLCIRECDFNNSAYAGGVAILCHPALWCTDTVFNKRITIENNVFTQANRRICSMKSCEEVIFRNNTFCSDPTLPAHAMHGEDGMTFKNCLNVIKDELLIKGE